MKCADKHKLNHDKERCFERNHIKNVAIVAFLKVEQQNSAKARILIIVIRWESVMKILLRTILFVLQVSDCQLEYKGYLGSMQL